MLIVPKIWIIHRNKEFFALLHPCLGGMIQSKLSLESLEWEKFKKK